MSRSRPRSAPLRAAIRSPRSLRRLPGRASAEPAAVHVAPEIYIRLAGSPEPGGSRAEPRREGAGGGRAARARGAGAGRRKGRAERPRRPPRSGARPPGPSPGPGPSRYTRGKVFQRPLPASPRLPASPAPASAGGAPLCQTVSTLCKDKDQREEEEQERERRGDVSWEGASVRDALPAPSPPDLQKLRRVPGRGE